MQVLHLLLLCGLFTVPSLIILCCFYFSVCRFSYETKGVLLFMAERSFTSEGTQTLGPSACCCGYRGYFLGFSQAPMIYLILGYFA